MLLPLEDSSWFDPTPPASFVCAAANPAELGSDQRRAEEARMGKGGEGGVGAGENMAAWLMGVNTLKILPFDLPPLGINASRACVSRSLSTLV